MKRSTEIKLRKLVERIIREETAEKFTKKISQKYPRIDTDDIETVVKMFLTQKSQAEIAKETGISINKVISITNELPHHSAGRDFVDDLRYDDDPMSKQYYNRTIKR